MNYFICYHRYLNKLKSLTDEEFGELFNALFEYSENGTLKNLSDKVSIAFDFIKEDIDRDKNYGHRIDYLRNSTPENQRDRNLKIYFDWRTSVFERDNYTCQLCNQHGGKLNAHHKKKWSEYPEFRFDVNNGITLCEGCHKSIHKKH